MHDNSLFLLYYVSDVFFFIIATSAIRYTRGIYRQGSSRSFYIISSCSGSENQLLNCSFSTVSYCSWGNEAGVRCYGKQKLIAIQNIVYTLHFTCSQFQLCGRGYTSHWWGLRNGRKGGSVSQSDMVGCQWLILLLELQRCHCFVQTSTLSSKL